MDTVGTFEMAQELSKHKMLVAIHKHYSIAQWKEFATKHPECLPYVAVSSGTSDAEFEKITTIINETKVLVWGWVRVAMALKTVNLRPCFRFINTSVID